MLLNVNISGIVFQTVNWIYMLSMCAQYPLSKAAFAHIIAYYSILSHAMYVFVNLICPLALPRQEAFKIIYSKFYSNILFQIQALLKYQMRMEHLRT